MKKLSKIVFAVLCFCTISSVFAESDYNAEARRFNESVESKGWQDVDSSAIFYRKSSNDGLSWRNRALNYDKNDKQLSKEKLMSTIWYVASEKDSSGLLIFYSDDYFAIGSRHADIYAFGKYSVANGKIILSDYDFNKNHSYCISLFNGDSVSGVLKYESDSLLYDNELVINGVSFYPADCNKENGANAKINNIPVIVDNSKKVMTDNVKFKEAPLINAKTQKVWLYDEMFRASVDSVKKGTVVHTLARTTKLEEYDGVKGYWYYISFSVVDSVQYGWIFGGYFSEYDKNNEAEYSRILAEEFKK